MTVLITGAARGIGLALTEAWRNRGARVIAATREAGAGDLTLDVTDPAGLHSAASQVPEPLRALVCNAGVYLDRGQRLEDGYDPAIWAQSFAVNVTGVFLTVQAFLPHLRAAAAAGLSPRIAIISSQMGSDERAPGGSYAYRASKAAALNLGRNLAADLRAEGIAVGIYHPGWVQTEMGGAGADITAQVAAAGLIARIEGLDLADTGSFETWDGRPHPF